MIAPNRSQSIWKVRSTAFEKSALVTISDSEEEIKFEQENIDRLSPGFTHSYLDADYI